MEKFLLSFFMLDGVLKLFTFMIESAKLLKQSHNEFIAITIKVQKLKDSFSVKAQLKHQKAREEELMHLQYVLTLEIIDAT